MPFSRNWRFIRVCHYCFEMMKNRLVLISIVLLSVCYAGRDFYVNDVLFSIKEQQHSAPSFRITVDKKLIYALIGSANNLVDKSGLLEVQTRKRMISYQESKCDCNQKYDFCTQVSDLGIRQFGRML